jgi:hypothetical protein
VDTRRPDDRVPSLPPTIMAGMKASPEPSVIGHTKPNTPYTTPPSKQLSNTRVRLPPTHCHKRPTRRNPACGRGQVWEVLSATWKGGKCCDAMIKGGNDTKQRRRQFAQQLRTSKGTLKWSRHLDRATDESVAESKGSANDTKRNADGKVVCRGVLGLHHSQQNGSHIQVRSWHDGVVRRK